MHILHAYIIHTCIHHTVHTYIYRKQQKFQGTKLSRFSRIFNETQKFSLLILGYGTSYKQRTNC